MEAWEPQPLLCVGSCAATDMTHKESYRHRNPHREGVGDRILQIFQLKNGSMSFALSQAPNSWTIANIYITIRDYCIWNSNTKSYQLAPTVWSLRSINRSLIIVDNGARKDCVKRRLQTAEGQLTMSSRKGYLRYEVNPGKFREFEMFTGFINCILALWRQDQCTRLWGSQHLILVSDKTLLFLRVSLRSNRWREQACISDTLLTRFISKSKTVY